MSDRDASISDATFREALDEFEEAVFTADIDNPNSGWVGASRARVLALYAEASRGQVTMPERVWLTPDVFNRLLGFYRSGRGGEYDAAADTLNAHDTALRTALLAAEARVREVEAELGTALDQVMLFGSDIDRLRAERDALVPLARRFLKLMDWARAHYAPVGGTWPLIDPMDHFTLTDLMDTTEVKQARAILVREAGE